MNFCSLYSGSSGNSIFIGTDNTRILIDAGLPGKKIDEALKSVDEDTTKIDGIFITHEHSDHIKGVGVLSRKYDIPIYANSDTWLAMKSNIGNVKDHNIKIMDKRSTVSIKDIEIKSFNIPHDAAGPVGYTVSNGKYNCSVVTDIGTFTEEIKQNIRKSDVILLESNHDVQMVKYGPYPYILKQRILSEIGHLSNENCGEAIVEIMKYGRQKHIFLGHLSSTNNQPDLAYQTVLNVLNENNLELDKDLILKMASRNNPSEYIRLAK
ncbi:Phosphoribosyl 1,2-cyclic phosphodiesterase [Clostridium cavendishii DSM 21758]|uniref:Phosphoribosyl 1,2-cyclic phosphodiesterase n=1 Tax=Clostridium cavendishii DSM 21758 TaxID=1121302 RepID=A0A1M6PSD9_9CLOT|nr:MBL fold metallo-hydrolase [Clostridium cavendishii]SHK10865.1 Phosphoribosyl 1,2-cyclic phosphodiesterase [Clostridium cavendishii DSM 21758]